MTKKKKEKVSKDKTGKKLSPWGKRQQKRITGRKES